MNKSSKSTGVGLAGLVFLVFLVLKLAKIGDVADWNWWWVTAPLWGGIALVIVFLIIAFALMALFKDSGKPYHPHPPKKSKFQQRLDDMQKQRESYKNK